MRPSASRIFWSLVFGIQIHPTYGSPLDQRDHTLYTRQAAISWAPCFDTRFDCASFDVPLDYANTTAGMALLALIRYNATRLPRLGALFTNPGGPGGSGVEDILYFGETYGNQTGGFYDIISWDPRGVNNSQPYVECFSSGKEEAAFWQDSLPWAGIEASTGFSDSNDITALYQRESETDIKLQGWGQRCQALSKDSLRYVGTVATVRDMVSIADALDGPTSPINFYGLSYGTVIGAYFVNIYPQRVGRVILDGVVNPVDWSTGPSFALDVGALQDSERVLRGFCERCSSSPNRCAYNLRGRSTATEIYDGIHRLIDSVRAIYPKGYTYGAEVVRDYLFLYMYAPLHWDDLALDIVAIEAEVISFIQEVGSNTTSFGSSRERLRSIQNLPPRWWLRDRETVSKLLGSVRSEMQQAKRRRRQSDQIPVSDYAPLAITCSDAVDTGNTTTKDVLDNIVRISQNVTPTFGPTWASPGYYCHRYPTRATERFQGPWDAKLANQILIIGNSADPITPLASAKFLADQLGPSAVLLEHNGFGHTSGAMPSNCTLQWIAEYMISGQLPPAGTVCTSSETLFRGEVEDDDGLNVALYATISPSSIPPARTSTSASSSVTNPQVENASQITSEASVTRPLLTAFLSPFLIAAYVLASP